MSSTISNRLDEDQDPDDAASAFARANAQLKSGVFGRDGSRACLVAYVRRGARLTVKDVRATWICDAAIGR